MKNRRALTGRQKQVLGCIIDYQREHGFSPSIRDLCEMTGLRSSSSIHFHLKALEEKGYIERLRECPRAVSIVREES